MHKSDVLFLQLPIQLQLPRPLLAAPPPSSWHLHRKVSLALEATNPLQFAGGRTDS